MKTIYLRGTVGVDITADGIRKQIEGSREKLRVIVNSPGGSAVEGFEIYNLFRDYKGEKEFVIAPYAASAAGYFILSGKISAYKNSIFMAHKSWTVGIGDSDTMRTEAEILDGIDTIMAEALSAKMKKPRAEILGAMKNEIWLIGWEALTDSGIIDNVIDAGDIDMPDEISADIAEVDNLGERVAQVARMKCKQAQDRAKTDDGAIRESMSRAAALLQDFKPAEMPEENKTISGEDIMTLTEILGKNPDVKAEYETNLLSAETKGRESANAEKQSAIMAERDRVVTILGKCGVEIPAHVADALDKGVDITTFALSELDRQKELRAGTNRDVFSALKPRQTPGEQDAGSAGAVKKTAEEIEANAVRLAEKLEKEMGGM